MVFKTIDGGTTSTRMVIDRYGKVGIGTTSPLGHLDINTETAEATSVYINGEASQDKLLLIRHYGNSEQAGALAYAGFIGSVVDNVLTLGHYNSSGSEVQVLNITEGGNVGIGTASPSNILHLRATTPQMYIQSNDGQDCSIIFGDASDASRGQIKYTSSDEMLFFTNNLVEAMRIDSSGNLLMQSGNLLNFNNSSDANYGRIYADSEGLNFDTVASRHTRFHTAGSEKMRIDTSGNLGIGTASPNKKLHIKDTASSNSLVTMKVENSLGNAEFGTQSNYARILCNGTLLHAHTGSVHYHYIGGSAVMALTVTGLGIGNTVPAYRLDVTGDARISSGSLGVGVNPNSTDGRGDFSNDVVAYSTSDKRLKENIKPLDSALDKVLQISGVEFDWKELTEEEKKTIHGNQGHDVGVIAQEIEEVLPEVVTTRDSGYKAVKYEKIVPLLIEAIKELKQEINELKNSNFEYNIVKE
jgi:hypothetical protein